MAVNFQLVQLVNMAIGNSNNQSLVTLGKWQELIKWRQHSHLDIRR